MALGLGLKHGTQIGPRRAQAAGEPDNRRVGAGWSTDKVRALSTEAILERLAECGIVTSAEGFTEQARAEDAASTIAAGWRERSRSWCVGSMMISSSWPRLYCGSAGYQSGRASRCLTSACRMAMCGYGPTMTLCERAIGGWRCGKASSCISDQTISACVMSTRGFMVRSISSTGARSSKASSAMLVSTTHAIRRARIQYVNEFLTQFSAEDDTTAGQHAPC